MPVRPEACQDVDPQSQRVLKTLVQSTYIVECRVSILENFYDDLGKYSPSQYLGPFGKLNPGPDQELGKVPHVGTLVIRIGFSVVDYRTTIRGP